jgi:integrase
MPYEKKELKNNKKTKVWIGQVRKDNKRREKRFKLKKEAEAWEVKMRGQSSEDWLKTTNTVSLGDWSLQYMDYAKDKFSKGTYEEKKAVFLRFFEMVNPTTSIERMSSAQAMQYSQVQMRERSGNAANKDRKNLMAAWNWGLRYMDPPLPKDNPFDIVKMPEIRSPRYVPTLEDFWKVYNVAEGQDKVMLLACLFLAARRGEIFRLKVQDLDFENDKVRLWTRKREDGNLEYDWLPMGTKLRESFNYWLDNREIRSEFVFICVDKTEFTKEYYGQPFTSRQHFFERLCKKAKVDKFGFHAIRHLTATQLYKQGRNVSEIQRVLRHTSPNTTVRYLKTLGVDDIRTAMDSFQAICKEALD